MRTVETRGMGNRESGIGSIHERIGRSSECVLFFPIPETRLPIPAAFAFPLSAQLW